jgi:uncharacterized protein YgiM (DUF1202 family)
VQPTDTIIGSALITAAPGINVRSGPGAEYADLGDLMTGVIVYVVEKSGDWVRIGKNAWIKTGPGLSTWTTTVTL